jgi:hypothetical protein
MPKNGPKNTAPKGYPKGKKRRKKRPESPLDLPIPSERHQTSLAGQVVAVATAVLIVIPNVGKYESLLRHLDKNISNSSTHSPNCRR